MLSLLRESYVGERENQKCRREWGREWESGVNGSKSVLKNIDKKCEVWWCFGDFFFISFYYAFGAFVLMEICRIFFFILCYFFFCVELIVNPLSRLCNDLFYFVFCQAWTVFFVLFRFFLCVVFFFLSNFTCCIVLRDFFLSLSVYMFIFVCSLSNFVACRISIHIGKGLYAFYKMICISLYAS